jgi:hypothetical protein
LFNYSTSEKVGNKKGSTRFTDPVTGEVWRSRVSGQGGNPCPIHGGEPWPDVPLSKAHSRPEGDGKAEFWLGGGLITVSKPKVGEAVQLGGGRRGKITEFSRASRRRMLYMMAKTDKRKKPVFITLTYPDDYPGSPKEWKRDLKIFLQRFRRHFNQTGGVWKLEPQKRGAPHYHMIAWIPYNEMKKTIKWVADNWYEVVGSGDINHWKWHMGLLGKGNVPCVGSIKSERGVMGYAGKYVGKMTEDYDLAPELVKAWGEAGKWWGIFGDVFIPWGELITAAVDFKEAAVLMRYMRRAAHFRSRQYQTLNLLCGADFWFDRLDRLLRP